MDISRWQEAARLAGYDRMVIHDRDTGDAQEVGNFLSVYRRGESWSRWCFARRGDVVTGWCCLTGADMGEFDSLAAALAGVLNGAAPERARTTVMPACTSGAIVVNLVPRMKACVRSFGSAA